MNAHLKAEVENYPHFVLIICNWWRHIQRQRDYQISYNYLQGASVAFSILGRFELSDEMDLLKYVMDTKLHHKYLQDRHLEIK
jgi:hypothetical protein